MSIIRTIDRAEVIDGVLICDFTDIDTLDEDGYTDEYTSFFRWNDREGLDDLRRRLDEVVYPMEVDCLDRAYMTARIFLAENYGKVVCK